VYPNRTQVALHTAGSTIDEPVAVTAT